MYNNKLEHVQALRMYVHAVSDYKKRSYKKQR